MSEWLAANKSWFLSGLGVLLIAALWGVLKLGYSRWRGLRAESVRDGLSGVDREHVRSRALPARLPRVLLRAILKPAAVAGRVHIALRESNPIAKYLQNPIPELDLYLTVTNLSSLDLVLDRMVIDVWFGQPTFGTALLTRHFIPAGEITGGITIRQFLTREQKAQIEGFYEAPMGGTIHIYIAGYFSSAIGDLAVTRSIEVPRS